MKQQPWQDTRYSYEGVARAELMGFLLEDWRASGAVESVAERLDDAEFVLEARSWGMFEGIPKRCQRRVAMLITLAWDCCQSTTDAEAEGLMEELPKGFTVAQRSAVWKALHHARGEMQP